MHVHVWLVSGEICITDLTLDYTPGRGKIVPRNVNNVNK